MKILLLGSRGLIGSAILSILKASNEEVFTPTHTECNVTQASDIERILDQVHPDVVINATGYTAVDKAEADSTEKERCFLLNATAPKLLTLAAQKIGALMVHISTDYVFDGTAKTPYVESSATNPLSVYGKSKLEGEQAVLAYEKSIVARTAWPFGPGGKNFVDTMLDLAAHEEPIRVVNDQTGSPTYTLDFANALYQAILSQTRGVVHLVNSGQATWHQLASEIFEILGVPRTVEPISTAELNKPAPRPVFSVLANTKIPQLRSCKEALSEYLFHKEFVLKA